MANKSQIHYKFDFHFFASFQIGIGWFEKVDESSLPLKTSKRNFQMLNISFLVFFRSNWEDKPCLGFFTFFANFQIKTGLFEKACIFYILGWQINAKYITNLIFTLFASIQI
jgi:hypothetical protein